MKPRSASGSILGWLGGLLLLLALLALLHWSVGWEALLAPWREVEFPALLLALLLLLGSYGVRTVRVHELFHSYTRKRFPGTFQLVLAHNLYNNLLPMRSGEASFPLLMKRDFGVPLSSSIPGLIYLRVLDLHTVLMLGMAAVSWNRLSMGWLAVIVLAPLPLVMHRWQGWLARHLDRRESPWAQRGRELLHGFPSKAGPFWRIWLWTVVNWSVKLLVLAWILRMFLPMPLAHALVGSITGELSSVLPFHGVAGAGTYEAGVLVGLLPLGLELDAALKAAVNLHLFVLGVSVLAGLPAALFPSVGTSPAGSGGDS